MPRLLQVLGATEVREADSVKKELVQVCARGCECVYMFVCVCACVCVRVCVCACVTHCTAAVG